jgi:hypothetical protein
LERDGRFSAPSTPFTDRVSWCLHRQGTDIDEASVWLIDETGGSVLRLNVKRLTPTELHLKPPTSSTVRLERA